MSYRSVQLKNFSDSEESSGSEDSDSIGNKKSNKRRCALVPTPRDSRQNSVSPNHSANGFKMDATKSPNQKVKPARKVNSIWSDVVTEQQLSQTISGVVSVKGPRLKIRGPESYNWLNAAAAQSDSGGEEGVAGVAAKDHIGKQPLGDADQSVDAGDKSAGVKGPNRMAGASNRPFKPQGNKRPYQNLQNHRQLCPMKFGVKFQANEEEDPVSLAEKFSNALHERKADLVTRCLRTLGLSKCVELYDKTEKIERQGGMLTLNSERRRSPGGIFLFCLKEDKKITEKQKVAIFGESKLEERKISKAKRRTKSAIPQSFKDSLDDLRAVIHKRRNPAMETTEQKSMEVDGKIWKEKKDVCLDEHLENKRRNGETKVGAEVDPASDPHSVGDSSCSSSEVDMDEPILL